MIYSPMEAGACDHRERLEDHPSSPPTRPLKGMLWGSSQKGGHPFLRPPYFGVRPAIEFDHVNYFSSYLYATAAL